MDKRQRSYRLLVGPTRQNGVVVNDEVVTIEPPFSIEFEVARQTLQQVNNARIRVYNLSESNRRKLYKDDWRLDLYKGVQLDAGYGDIKPTIFRGNVQHGWSVRQGDNFISHLECFDGGDASLNAVINKAFAKGTPNSQMIKEVIDSFGKYGVSPGVISQVQGSLKRGNSISGNSAEIASVLSNNGFYIDLERAHILKDEEYVVGAFETVDSDAGLLGTPLLSKTRLTFEMIFEPRVIMSQLVSLNSKTEKNFNGRWKVVGINHRGLVSESVAGDAVTGLTLWRGPNNFLQEVNRG